MADSIYKLCVVVSTYQRPAHLERCLLSLCNQTLDANQFQVVIADDGSRDETEATVRQFQRNCPLAITFCTQPNQGFRKARAVNNGLRQVVAPYVVLTDGDCIFPPDHLEIHLSKRQRGVVWCGNSVFLDQQLSEQIDAQSVRSGKWLERVPKRLPNAMWAMHKKALIYQAIGHPTKPKLIGNNVGVWLDQLLEVNGYDQSFEGWGCEDDDLGLRLRKKGYEIRSFLGQTHAYHLWHPVHETKPLKWIFGPNVARFRKPLLSSYCLNGMNATPFETLSVRIKADADHAHIGRELAQHFQRVSADRPTLEIRFWPSETKQFSGAAECNVLVGEAFDDLPKKLNRQVSMFIQHALADAPLITEHILSELRIGLGIEASNSYRPSKAIKKQNGTLNRN